MSICIIFLLKKKNRALQYQDAPIFRGKPEWIALKSGKRPIPIKDQFPERSTFSVLQNVLKRLIEVSRISLSASISRFQERNRYNSFTYHNRFCIEDGKLNLSKIGTSGYPPSRDRRQDKTCRSKKILINGMFPFMRN